MMTSSMSKGAVLIAGAGAAVVGALWYARKRDKKIRLPNGITVVEDSPGLAKVIYDQVVDYFEHPDGGAPTTIFRDGMVVVDVGMNIGLFSIELLRRAKERDVACKVFGFEPIPATYAVAKANLEMNGALAPDARQRSIPLNVGCSKESGTVSFTHLPGWSARSSMMAGAMNEYSVHHWTSIEFMTANLHKLPSAYRALVPRYVKLLPRQLAVLWHSWFCGGVNARLTLEEKVEAKLVTLSSIIGEEPHIDLLKVDVERAELLVLQGLIDKDFAKVGAAVLEVHDEGFKLAAIKELMTKAGLIHQRQVQEVVFEGTDVWTLICSRS